MIRSQAMKNRMRRVGARVRDAVVVLALAVLGWSVSPTTIAQTQMLSQLPYQDPRALDALLALDESRFATTMTTAWPQTEKTLARYLPPGISIAPASLFFSSNRSNCLIAHQPAACRVLIDFMAFLMKSKEPASAATVAPTSLPVLMRPAQLPWRDTAILNALLLLDAARFQSALSAHWSWIHDVITRFLPDNFDLHPVSKVFGSVRDTCNSAHSEVACRLHVSDVDAIVDNNRRQPRTLFRTLSQLAYRDPAPLDALLALNETQLRTQLSGNWPQINDLLNQTINANIALAGAISFARSRLDCQAWMPGEYFMCRTYMRNVSALMHSKAALPGPVPMANPFGKSR